MRKKFRLLKSIKYIKPKAS